VAIGLPVISRMSNLNKHLFLNSSPISVIKLLEIYNSISELESNANDDTDEIKLLFTLTDLSD
jgi:hypothetical protein